MGFFSYSIEEEKGKIVDISLNIKKSKRTETALERKCRKEINEYLEGKRKKFSIPFIFEGTEFQKKVWKEMIKIPYGETVSYGVLSKKIGKPKAYRAVANACGANKIPIIIPCHRVVASDGIGGYSSGVMIKKKLLQIEGKKKKGYISEN